MRRLLPLLALVAVLGAGCGNRTPSDEEQIRALLGTFAKAAAARDYQTLCDKVLAPKLLNGIAQIGLPCEIALRQSLGEVKSPRMTVGQISVKGDNASAEVRTSAENQPPSKDTVKLQRVNGRWRV